MILKKILKRIIRLIFAFILLLALYFAIAYTLSFFPTRNIQSEKTQTIYILYNKMHSDIVFKLNSTTQKWSKILPTLIKNQEGYIAFGWGDKETYINTPTWDDLSISTTLKALFIDTPSLMHVTHISNLQKYQNIKKIKVSKEQLIAIENTVLKSFNLQTNQHYKAYSNNDLFYPSNYKYNIFKTCNTWTGDTLRDANISISYWTPLSDNVVSSLPET